MVWADTSWVVTGVCDVFSRWPLSVFKKPRYAVGVLGLQVDAESAISVVQQVCFPHPASVGLIYFFPETFFYWSEWSFTFHCISPVRRAKIWLLLLLFQTAAIHAW